MQNKPVLIGIAAAIIILLGVGGIFLYSKNKTVPTPNNTQVTATPTPKTSEIEGSIKDIFLTSGNKQCNFSVSDKESETKGVFYVSGNKTAGEMTTTSKGKDTKTFIIRADDTFYIWGDTAESGVKLKISVDELASQASKFQSTFNPDQKISYKCASWVVVGTKFTPPTNIKFTDLSSFKLPTR